MRATEIDASNVSADLTRRDAPAPVQVPVQEVITENHRDANGNLTRAGMEHVLRTGGSVTVTRGGKTLHILKPTQISEGLAMLGTNEDRSAITNELRRQRDEIDAQILALAPSRK